MNWFDKVMDRVRDPGSLRSLTWVAMGVLGLPQTDATVDTAAGCAAIVLGAVSALMKPRATVVLPAATQ